MNILREVKVENRFRIPATTSQTPSVTGQIAIDTDGDGTDNTQGIIKYYDGTRVMYGVAVDTLPTSDGHVATYDATLNKIKFAAPGSISTDTTWLNNLQGDRVYGQRMINSNSRLDAGIAFDESITGGSAAYVVQTAALAAHRKLTTNTVSDTDAYVYIAAATNNPFYDSRSWHLRVICALNSVANVRMVIGMCASAGYGHYAATLPANSVVFRFDTAVPDTNYQFITKDATTATTTNTTVAADTGVHKFDIIFDDSTNTYTGYIDGTLRATHTSNLPVAATQSYMVAGTRTLTGSAKEFLYSNILFIQKVQ